VFSACFSISLHIINRFCVFNIQLTFLSACFFPFLYIFLFLQREFVKKNALTLLRARAMIDIWDCRRFPHVGADSRVCPCFGGSCPAWGWRADTGVCPYALLFRPHRRKNCGIKCTKKGAPNADCGLPLLKKSTLIADCADVLFEGFKLEGRFVKFV
jgi:hypothetical protein